MYDVCVIGCGRVGLPLALAMYSNGLKVVGIDLNEDLIGSVNEKREMPFNEPGFEEILRESDFTIINARESFPDASTYVITVGTPLMQHIETDLSHIKKVIDKLIDEDKIKGRLIILRSTVAPRTTQLLKKYIEQKTNLKMGYGFYLAMCPERLAEGMALKELYQLPQIIGVEDDKSYEAAVYIFETFKVEMIRCNFITAELSKLLCNIYRYINFAIPNYFTYIADKFGADVFEVFNVMNKDYPRNAGLKSPGFAAGTCVPGYRKIKVYETAESKRCVGDITFKDLFENFKHYYVDSFIHKLEVAAKKKIINCTHRKFTGVMVRVMFDFEGEEYFECTEDHLIPMEIDDETYIGKSNTITPFMKVYRFKNGGVVKERVKAIVTYSVEDFDVYNLELETPSKQDDLFYVDAITGLVHHNCLRKDFGMISENMPHSDLLVQAYKVNEFMPKFYVDKVKDKIYGKAVAVLGYTMKRDADDTRDSLVPKMIRYIERLSPQSVMIHEPNLPMGTTIIDKENDFEFLNNWYESAILRADVIFIAMNHSVFDNLTIKHFDTGIKIVDIWGVLKQNNLIVEV